MKGMTWICHCDVSFPYSELIKFWPAEYFACWCMLTTFRTWDFSLLIFPLFAPFWLSEPCKIGGLWVFYWEFVKGMTWNSACNGAQKPMCHRQRAHFEYCQRRWCCSAFVLDFAATPVSKYMGSWKHIMGFIRLCEFGEVLVANEMPRRIDELWQKAIIRKA